jgi:hypothetical protein
LFNVFSVRLICQLLYVGWGEFFYGLVSVVGRVLGGLPLVLAALLLLGSLQLLDASGLVYYPTIHRATITRVFSLGFSLVVPLAVLVVAWFALMWVGGGAVGNVHYRLMNVDYDGGWRDPQVCWAS